MPDEPVGISLRLIRLYDATKDRPAQMCLMDHALALAISDPREDVDFGVKLTDALTFLKRRIH